MEQKRCEDIRVGNGTVKAHAGGGWALPGGDRTDDLAVATWIAVQIDQLIGDRLSGSNREWLNRLRGRRSDESSRPCTVTLGGRDRRP